MSFTHHRLENSSRWDQMGLSCGLDTPFLRGQICSAAGEGHFLLYFFFLLFFFMVLTLSHLPRNWGDLRRAIEEQKYVRKIFSIASCSVNRSWPYHRECKWSYHNVLLKICCIMHRRKVWVTSAFYYFYLFFLLHSALWGLDALSLCCAALATEAEQDEEAFLLNTAVSL